VFKEKERGIEREGGIERERGQRERAKWKWDDLSF
jgi:hypothetical protein